MSASKNQCAPRMGLTLRGCAQAVPQEGWLWVGWNDPYVPNLVEISLAQGTVGASFFLLVSIAMETGTNGP